MAERSYPWPGTTVGDAGPYTAANWQELYRFGMGARGDGPLRQSGDGTNAPLQVNPTSPAGTAVEVEIGSAMIQGVYYRNTAAQNLTIAANASGNPRIDRIVLRVDYTAQTVRLVVKQGTAAANPSVPSLTQTAGVLWEISLARVAVANSFVSIAAADIFIEANYADGGVTSGFFAPVGRQGVPNTDWLLCYGQAVSRLTYGTLMNALAISGTGSRTNGSAIITGLASTNGMGAGQKVEGLGIPAGATILTVDSATQITLSANATSTGTALLVVFPWGAGDGSTTFNVPDYRGRSVLGNDSMGGTAANVVTDAAADALGGAGGAQLVTLAITEIPTHHHTVVGRSVTTGSSNVSLTGNSQANSDPTGTADVGGGGSHQNMSPYRTANVMVRV